MARLIAAIIAEHTPRLPAWSTANRALSVGSKLRHQVPLPGSRIDVRRGKPLDSDATRDDCQRALDALGRPPASLTPISRGFAVLTGEDNDGGRC